MAGIMSVEVPNLRVTDKVIEKLAKKHSVQLTEVHQAWMNRIGATLIDDREQHRTDPPTRWFIAETDRRRLLKIVFIQRGPHIDLRTAYAANQTEINLYQKKSGASF